MLTINDPLKLRKLYYLRLLNFTIREKKEETSEEWKHAINLEHGIMHVTNMTGQINFIPVFGAP